MTDSAEPLWIPPPERVADSNIQAFKNHIESTRELILSDSRELYRWSVDFPDLFWADLVDYMLPGVRSTGRERLGSSSNRSTAEDAMTQDWFPGTQLNVADVILNGLPGPHRGQAVDAAFADAATMFLTIDELGNRRETTRGAAREQVGQIAAALRAEGVQAGDRVVVWMPNVDVTMLVMLAAASIGAVFSSTSPDFGADGVLDRFSQIKPKVLVAANGYSYGGKSFDRRTELAKIIEGLPTLTRCVLFEHIVLTSSGDDEQEGLTDLDKSGVVAWADWIAPYADAELSFVPLDFNQPWYVLFSSGTTGVPKCIVHRSGGILLQHMKEHQLHCDIGAGDRVCYFTTCGWMMWNWLASAPASGATAVLFDGNPFHPGPEKLWELAADESLSFLGVSAKYLDAVKKSGFAPAERLQLRELRTLASTGSPLVAESFDWVYEHVAPACDPSGLHLASISGGTDICGVFVGGDPTQAVWRGEIQAPQLGMAIDVWTDEGATAAVDQRGELVCAAGFPSMPIGFWNDELGERYRRAYFERFDGPWAQGDFATWTSHGGLIIHGRSDTTLNPGGVRIGTAEIYRQVEQISSIQESLVFGREVDGDVQIVLLVICVGHGLDDDLAREIRTRIRTGCSPRHVPALIVEVDDLPRTRSGKLAELAVADTVNGRRVRNTTALANPETLERIAGLVERAV